MVFSLAAQIPAGSERELHFLENGSAGSSRNTSRISGNVTERRFPRMCARELSPRQPPHPPPALHFTVQAIRDCTGIRGKYNLFNEHH